jgi:RNA polymerase sigma factor (sigma-70 family)
MTKFNDKIDGEQVSVSNISNDAIDTGGEQTPLSELAMRFTGWLKIVVKRAKIDYLRSQKRYGAEVPLEHETASDALLYDFRDASGENQTGFDFEDEKIAVAFSKLQPKRRQVLTMLFVQNLTSEEIADYLHCSVQHVYNQRSLALKELKSILSKEEK